MISEFIYKYYIDPIRYGQPYNVVDTLTYAVILICSVYLIYRWLKVSGIAIDRPFVLATMPYVVLGGVLRVVQDTGMIASDLQFFLVTPLIYFVLFFYAAGMLFFSRFIGRQGLVGNFLHLYGAIGAVTAGIVALILLSFGMAHTRIAVDVLLIIPLMAVAASAAVWGFMRYGLKWAYASDPLFVALIFGHMLDASATSYGIDLHPLAYVEQHVVGSNLIAWTGTAFVMFPLKLLVLFPAIYILEMYRTESEPDLWHLILLAMIVVGLAPGIRDMIRMVLYV
jgi:uncharacterized membrane protein